MRIFVKKIGTLFLFFTLIFILSGCKIFKKQVTYTIFGSYPQTLVSDSALLASLKKLTTPRANGYYLYKGEEYAKVVARPFRTDYTFNNGDIIIVDQTYFFKVEPIKWRVLEETDGTYTLLSEYIIDQHDFYTSTVNRKIGEETIYPNNYEYSSIREWLNNGFYNQAFTASEKEDILESLVDNSAATTDSSTNQYISNNTCDKVYLLSYQEALSSNYGFKKESSRITHTTEYAKAKGVQSDILAEEIYGVNSSWWLRSPDYENVTCSNIVTQNGNALGTGVKNYWVGVRPVIKIG